jgi:hypothetical protein
MLFTSTRGLLAAMRPAARVFFLSHEVCIMASIVIRDLTENTSLDHDAMAAIVGGARLRGRPANVGPAFTRGARIVEFPSGVQRSRTAAGPSGASDKRK